MMKHLYCLYLGLLLVLPLTPTAKAQDAQDRAVIEKISDKKLRKTIEKSLSEALINGRSIAILRVKDRKLKSAAADQIIYVQARLDGFLNASRRGETIETGDVPDRIQEIQTLDPVWPVHFYQKELQAYSNQPTAVAAEPQQPVAKTIEESKPAPEATPKKTAATQQPVGTVREQTTATKETPSLSTVSTDTPAKSSETFSLSDIPGWGWIVLGSVLFLWVQKRRHFKKCPQCGKWNAMRRSGSWHVVDTEASYVTKELKTRNRRGEVVRTEECTVPATIYTYRMHRLCKYRKCGCTGEDYIYKKVKREN
ncbi:hypothetical protein [Rikenella microfusus]|nr:hypothetical protein [Rikenella microfusus]